MTLTPRHVPQELAQEIQDAAERDAQSRTSGQPQRYVVFAYRGTEAMHESQHAFLVKVDVPLARFGDDSEPATEKGVISHYMRHDENVHRLLMSAGDALLGKLAVDLERERACRVKAEELNWSMIEKYQTLLDREHERRVDEAKELMRRGASTSSWAWPPRSCPSSQRSFSAPARWRPARARK